MSQIPYLINLILINENNRVSSLPMTKEFYEIMTVNLILYIDTSK